MQLRGLVKAGAGDSLIFTLSAGYRPLAQRIYVAHCEGASLAHLDVKANGDVVLSQPVAGTLSWLSIDGIAFFIE